MQVNREIFLLLLEICRKQLLGTVQYRINGHNFIIISY